MNAPSLIRHGAHVKPHYAPAPGEVASWAGKSTDEDRPDGNNSGIVKRYSKKQKASEVTHALGLIAQQYRDAIRYNVNLAGLRGLAMISGLLGSIFSIWSFFYTAPEIYFWPSTSLLDVPLWFISPLFLFAGILLLTWSIRLELFRPIDEPTIFDRKHRKVYRIFCEAQPGWTGLFKPWPMRAVEYHWDLIDAEHTATLVTTGSTIRREHALVFIVRRSSDDPTIIDSFNIGNSLIMVTDDAVDAVWEHIRRFMEDNGPHLPPGETVTVAPPTRSLWQKLLDISPFRRTYWEWWREQLPLMLLAHVLFPVSIPFVSLWLFLGWLSEKTARPIEWPPEVIEAIGPSIQC